jgi:6-pyruvoyl-tetrahydropterin synthase
MVADFALIKEIVGGWVDKEWDHKMVLNAQDPMLWVKDSLTDPGTPLDPDTMMRRYGHRPFVMAEEPTAENMAKFLVVRDWFADHPTLRHKANVTTATVFETDTCSATCSLSEL